MLMFQRFLVAIARLFPTDNRVGEANSRREFLGSALRVGVGLATLQFLGVVRSAGLAASPAALSCRPELGDGPCGSCGGCDCCETNWLECEAVDDFCISGEPCWYDEEEEFTCCDYCCPEEGFCCVYHTLE